MNVDKEFELAVKRFHDLAAQRKEILALPPEQALDRILTAPNPAALVHSFPEQDLHFLVHEIGPEDSLPLLAQAADRQWEYMVDVETWEKDRISLPDATRWLHLLHGADPMRFIRWFLKEKTEFIELYLFKTMEVRLREHDQDPGEFGQGFFTLDGTIYIRLFDDHPSVKRIMESGDPSGGSTPGDFTVHRRQEFLKAFLKNLADFDHPTYQKVIIEATHVTPSKIEEESLRFRNARLAEKGFLPFDEAVGVYQPLNPDQVQIAPKAPDPARLPGGALISPPRYPIGMLDADDVVARALMEIDEDGLPDDLQLEFATLCNRVASADGKPINNQEQLRTIVRKVGGFIRMGVDALVGAHAEMASDQGPAVSESQCAAMMRGRSLVDLFRVGWGRVLKLKWRTEKWLRTSWFKSAGLPLTFWDEVWTGVLGGLLIKKPLCFDDYQGGELYREFSGSQEIMAAQRVLDDVIAIDDLLSLMNISFDRPLSDYGFITYKNLLLTPWARHHLNHGEVKTGPTPLSLEEFTLFFKELFSDASGEVMEEGRTIRTIRTIRVEMKTAFLNWLSASTGLTGDEISERMGDVLETLFKEIEDELGRVSEANLDPRWIHLFLIE